MRSILKIKKDKTTTSSKYFNVRPKVRIPLSKKYKELFFLFSMDEQEGRRLDWTDNYMDIKISLITNKKEFYRVLGVKNCPKLCDVIYGQPHLIYLVRTYNPQITSKSEKLISVSMRWDCGLTFKLFLVENLSQYIALDLKSFK